jgi:2-polyprenyl-3-methyl-5-hydroxy-6-metoxy-1,4-benzoquinol methylase
VQKPEESWKAFWHNQAHSFDEVMKVSTSHFARKFIEKFKITSNDAIFDYGCGPGFLADSLASIQVKTTGADINPSYVEQCRRNHPESKTFLITADLVSNQKILNENLDGEKFDFIVLLSISQYLESVDALENIIRLLKPYLNNRGKIVIADVVDPKTSALRDLIAIKFQCIRAGKLIAFVRFFFYLLFSNYRSLSRNVQLLHISEENMKHIASSTSLRCEKVNGLTLHPTRTNYCFSP